jgi:dTDP-4-dehydrorhamnose 3,5-epimerase
MIKQETKIKDCYLIGHTEHIDNRGVFKEIYRESDFWQELGCNFIQNNVSYSREGVLRGLHVTTYAKLVGCLSGQIYDVVVDFRKKSETYLNVFCANLHLRSNFLMFVPPGCGHGFLAIEDSVVFYAQSGYYNPENEQIFNFFDPKLNICLPQSASGHYWRSEKDENAKNITENITD